MLTVRWWSLLLAGLALAGWGIISSPVLLGLAAGVACMLVAPLAFRAPTRAEWRDLSAPVRVTRGDAASLSIAVSITGTERWVIASGTDSGSLRCPGETDSGLSLLEWPIDTSRRGVFAVGPDRLAFAEPFGLRSRVLATRTPTSVTVVPRVLAVPALTSVRSRAEGLASERWGTDQFHSLREYSPGDPMKLIHWRASARTGALVTRRLVDSTLPTLMVALDTSHDAYDSTPSAFADHSPELFERAVELAASYAWQHAGAGMRVFVTTTALGTPVVDVDGRSREAALDWLATVGPSHADGSGGARRVSELLRRRSVTSLVFVTGPHAHVPGVITMAGRSVGLTVARAQ